MSCPEVQLDQDHLPSPTLFLPPTNVSLLALCQLRPSAPTVGRTAQLEIGSRN